MTEEVKVELPDQEAPPEETKKEQPQLSPIEEQALSMGWRPRTEFDGSDDEFVDAKEFVRRKPLFDRLDQQGKQLKNVTKALDQLKGHYSKMREVEFQRALTELKSARRQALSDSDGERFEVLDDRIKEVEKEAEKLTREAEVPTNAPDPAEFQQWHSRNGWYQKDEAMTAFADRVGNKYKDQVDRGDMTPLQALQKIEQAVKTEFQHKFRNPNKDTAPNVGDSAPGAKKGLAFQLTEEENKIMTNLVRQKVMTKEEYIRDLKLAKGL